MSIIITQTDKKCSKQQISVKFDGRMSRFDDIVLE